MATSLYRAIFLDKLWPDFMPNDLLKKLKNIIIKLKRNFGGI